MSSGKPKVRRTKARISNLTAAWIALVVVLLACYMVFDGAIPFTSSGYTLRAVFTSNTDLHLPSPVRIAGVDVGQVVHVERLKGSPDAAILVMQIDNGGLPIHSDATAAIRSRTFLEGNFYVALSPGTPNSPILPSGSTLPAANTSGPVQLDRVVSALNSNARSDLQKVVQGLGGALNGASVAGDQAGQAPSVKYLTGAQGLNYALKYSAGAFEASAIVDQALLGERPHDLSGAVSGQAAFFEGLARSGDALGTLIDGFDKTVSALASQQTALSETIAVLPDLLRAADSADTSLQAAFTPTQQFAKNLTGSIGELPATITATLPWLKQATLLTSRGELGGLLAHLSPAVRSSSVAVGGLKTLAAQSGELAHCFTKVLIPNANARITVDPSLSSTQQVYQQLMQSFVGIAGAAGNFDGNGHYTRVTVGGGSDLVKTKAVSASTGPLYGNAVLAPLGTFPEWPSSGKAPVLDSGVACYTQSAPNLNASAKGGTP